MSTYDWPPTWSWRQLQEPVLVPNVREWESPFNGDYHGLDLLGERFRMAVTMPPCTRAEGAERSAFFNRLRGVHKIRVWNLARPVPRGTLQGNGYTVGGGGAAQGASAIGINGAVGATLLAGDMLGVAGMLLQVAEDCTWDGSGYHVVPLTNRLRTAVANGAAVTLTKPTTTWRVAGGIVPILSTPAYTEATEFELIESW